MLHCTTDPIRGRDRGLRVRVRVRGGPFAIRSGRSTRLRRPRVRLSSITNGETDSDRQIDRQTDSDRQRKPDGPRPRARDEEMLMIIGVGVSREETKGLLSKLVSEFPALDRPFRFGSDVRTGVLEIRLVDYQLPLWGIGADNKKLCPRPCGPVVVLCIPIWESAMWASRDQQRERARSRPATSMRNR